MAIPLKLGSDGRLQQIQSGDSLQANSFERLAGSGDLTIGSTLGAAEELVLGSSTSVVRVVGDFEADSFIEFLAITAPSNPPSTGLGRLYMKVGNDGLFWLPDTGGAEVDLTAAVASSEFADNVFRVQDDGDSSKELAFQLSGVTTSTVRVITMPDKDITLDDIADTRTPSAHTIVSHSDTSATGPELDELTDGSETTLHSHAGGGGTSRDTWRFALTGKISVSNEIDSAWIAPRAATITRVTLYRRTGGSSGTTTVDVNKNGTTIFTTQSNRPVTSGTGADQVVTGTLQVTAVAQDDRIEVDIDTAEAGNPQDLAVIIEVSYP